MATVKCEEEFDDDGFEEAFERFAIMTVDGGMNDEKAVAWVVKNYGFTMGARVVARIEASRKGI
jgi:hypothetical protein